MSDIRSEQRSLWRPIVGIIIVAIIGLFGRSLYHSYLRVKNDPQLPNVTGQGMTELLNAAARSTVIQTSAAYMNIADDPSRGPDNAKLVIVAFEDFQCPFCKANQEALQKVWTTYGNRVRFMYRDFPISDSHTLAQDAAEAGQCANAQGKFWQYHDLVFQHQDQLTMDVLSQLAIQAGLDRSVWNTCMTDHRFAQEIQQDFQDGLTSGVTGTPTFFFNGHKVSGVISWEGFQKIIEFFLTAQS